MDGYLHFIRVDANNIIIDGYADWQTEKRQQGEIQLTGEFGRQFGIQLSNDRGQFIYKLVNGAMVARTQTELDVEWNSRAPQPPTTEERLAATESALLSIMGL